jgi:glycosyltransferase involved in cell wall biosynthesis
MKLNYTVHFDDIVFSLQKFGGVTTYWNEMTSRVDNLMPGLTFHSSATKFERLINPISKGHIFHSSHFRFSRTRNVSNVTTVHDLIYEKKIIKGFGKYINLFERKMAIKNSDAIICISESTKNDFLEFYGEYTTGKQIEVIGHGSIFSAPIFTANKIDLGISALSMNWYSSFEGKYCLFVGGRSGYKNFNLCLLSFSQSGLANSSIKLLCTGANFTKEELALIDSLNLSRAVLNIGYISNGQLAFYYKNALALVYPSMYEGFGLPPLDAMACGCPVICSNSSSIPEVVGNAGLLCEPNELEPLKNAMIFFTNLVNRSLYKLKGLEQSKKFTWKMSALKHYQLYKRML